MTRLEMGPPEPPAKNSPQTEEAELRIRVERLQRIFRSSHHTGHGYGYFDWDLDAGRMGWSGGYWRHMGYTEADVEYISLSDNYYDYVHEDDLDTLKDAVVGILRDPGPRGVCYRVRSKKGDYIWTEIRCDATAGPDGRVSHVSGIAMDVTNQKKMEHALKASEERNRRILQSANDGIWEWSAEKGGFHFVRRCWEQLGFSSGDELLEHGLNSFAAWRGRIHPDDGRLFDHILEQHIKGEAPFEVEYRIRGKEDSWCWIRARGRMEFDENGQPVRMGGTNIDITALKEAEERVRKAKEQAEMANRAKSEFLSSMSHELRTPLNAILGFAQLLDFDSNLTDQQRDNVSEIQNAGKHLLQLVGDVLDLARIEAGRLTLSLERIFPVALLKESLNLVQTQAEARNIQLELVDNELREFAVTADCVRLKQIILNLLSNAVKYNRDFGKVIVSCSIVKTHFFRIEVEDTGYGIALERQAEVFQPFSRLGAEQAGVEGTGVGLVITQQLVKQMEGEIGFESEEGKGSKFWVEVPIGELGGATVSTDSVVGAENLQLNGVPTLSFTNNKKILYVEDNASNQRLMKQLIGHFAQLELITAEDAFRGLFIARTQQPDMIIMDIHLPGMDGFEALGILKQDITTKNIPVIALSANAMSHDIKKGRDAGFEFYLTKPINLHQLVEVLNKVLCKSECSQPTSPHNSTSSKQTEASEKGGDKKGIKQAESLDV